MGKNLSLISKVAAIMFAIVAFLGWQMPAGEVVIVATFIALSFSPIDASKIIKNVKAGK